MCLTVDAVFDEGPDDWNDDDDYAGHDCWDSWS